jgi:glycerol-3-phosphate responsive antiterminator
VKPLIYLKKIAQVVDAQVISGGYVATSDQVLIALVIAVVTHLARRGIV